jgi:5'-nucleotidase
MSTRAGRFSRVVVGVALVCVTALGVGVTSVPGAAAAPKQPTLRILVTNDDGVGAPGIDALVQGLRKLKGVRVTVVAPAENKSGSSDMTTPGMLTTTQTTTASGYPAIAVNGFPADTVNFALDGGIPTKPQLVASGVNAGQNLGPVAQVSGTVGAARAAVRRGVPAVAVSQGTGDASNYDYPAGVREAVRWVTKHRSELTSKKPKPQKDVSSINVPTCTVGKVRGIVQVPAATTGDIAQKPNCLSKVTRPADDVTAYANGYAAESPIPPG